jgi:hypothetical protein
MLRNYKYGDYTFQFEDDDVPEGAVLVEPVAANKAAPAKTNKARTPRKRTAKKAVKADDSD